MGEFVIVLVIELVIFVFLLWLVTVGIIEFVKWGIRGLKDDNS